MKKTIAQDKKDDLKYLRNKIDKIKTEMKETNQNLENELNNELRACNYDINNKIEIIAKTIKYPQTLLPNTTLTELVTIIRKKEPDEIHEERRVLSVNGVVYDFSVKYEDYKTTLTNLMKEMVIGILYRNKDQQKIYFKLKINNNHRRKFFWCFNDVKKYRGEEKQCFEMNILVCGNVVVDMICLLILMDG